VQSLEGLGAACDDTARCAVWCAKAWHKDVEPKAAARLCTWSNVARKDAACATRRVRMRRARMGRGARPARTWPGDPYTTAE
jgi:hypothetical protein